MLCIMLRSHAAKLEVCGVSIGLAGPAEVELLTVRVLSGEFTKQLFEEHKDWICDDWKGGEMKVLDYACGTGLASQVCSMLRPRYRWSGYGNWCTGYSRFRYMNLWNGMPSVILTSSY